MTLWHGSELSLALTGNWNIPWHLAAIRYWPRFFLGVLDTRGESKTNNREQQEITLHAITIIKNSAARKCAEFSGKNNLRSVTGRLGEDHAISRLEADAWGEATELDISDGLGGFDG